MKNYVLLFKKNNRTTKYTHEGLVQAYRNDTDRSIKSYNIAAVETNLTPEDLNVQPERSIHMQDDNLDKVMIEQLKTLAHGDGLVPDERSIWCIFTLEKLGPGSAPGITNMRREMIETSFTRQDYH